MTPGAALQRLAGSGSKPSPQGFVAPDRPAGRRLRRWLGFNGRREDPLEPLIIDPREVLAQDGGCRFILPQDCGAKLHAGPPEKSESRFSLVRCAEPVDLRGDRQNCQPVGIIQRDGKSQHGEMPRSQRPCLSPVLCVLVHGEVLERIERAPWAYRLVGFRSRSLAAAPPSHWLDGVPERQLSHWRLRAWLPRPVRPVEAAIPDASARAG
jgi:hypothetical protein